MGRISGLTISGTVKERRRRRVPADNPQHEFVTYSLIDEYNTLYFVDDFHPDKYYEIGQSVMLPVYVKTSYAAYAHNYNPTSQCNSNWFRHPYAT